MFEVAILVTERDEQGWTVGRLLHGKPHTMPDYVVQADGRVIDGEGRNLGRTVMGDVASSDGHYAGARLLALGHFDGHETSANLGHEADGTAAGDAGPLREDLVLAKHGRGWPDDRSEPTRDTLRLHGCAVAGRGMSPADATVRVAAEMQGRLCGPKELGCISHYAESVREARKTERGGRDRVSDRITHRHDASSRGQLALN